MKRVHEDDEPAHSSLRRTVQLLRKESRVCVTPRMSTPPLVSTACFVPIMHTARGSPMGDRVTASTSSSRGTTPPERISDDMVHSIYRFKSESLFGSHESELNFNNKIRKLSFDDTDYEEDEGARWPPVRNVLCNVSVMDDFPSQSSYFRSRSSPIAAILSNWNAARIRSRPTTPQFSSATMLSLKSSPNGLLLIQTGDSSTFSEMVNPFLPTPSPSRPSAKSFLAYNIQSMLGKGMSSEVFKVEDPNNRRKYAIKRSKNDSARMEVVKRQRKSFVMEVETFHMLHRSHCPNIPHIYNAWEEENHYYLLMECALYGSVQDLLASHVQRQLAMAPEIIGHILHDICQALQHLHGLGIVHLDIKPANMLIFDHGTVKLTDFGHVHIPDKREGCEGDKRYVARELFLVERWKPEPSADIFSLGASLFSMAFPSYSMPCEGDEWLALRANEYPSLPTHLGPGLNQIIADCLQNDPTKRPTAQNLLCRSPVVKRTDLISYLMRHDLTVEDFPPLIELNRSTSFTAAMATQQ